MAADPLQPGLPPSLGSQCCRWSRWGGGMWEEEEEWLQRTGRSPWHD